MIGYHIERENTFNMAQFSASVNDMFPAHAFNGLIYACCFGFDVENSCFCFGFASVFREFCLGFEKNSP